MIPSRKKSSRMNLMALGVATLIVVVGIISLVSYKKSVEKRLSGENFYPGIMVEGVDLGGMSMDEAKAAVGEALKTRLNGVTIELKYADKNWNFGYNDINYSTNVEKQLQAAYKLGRTGSINERIEEIDRLRKKGFEQEITVDFMLDALKDKLSEIKAQIDKPAVEPDIIMHPERTGAAMFEYTPEQEGRLVDIDTLYSEIERQFALQNNVSVEITTKSIVPTYKMADIKKANVLRSKFYTSLSGSTSNRMSNVRLALSKFNGLVIWPGQVLSFNAVTWPRDKEHGYLDAHVISPTKEIIDDVAGGVCQSSTTLYVAWLKAGLKSHSRYHHSFPSTYVPKGLDATVNGLACDLKLLNDSNMPVAIKYYTKNDNVYVEVYGLPITEGDYYDFISEPAGEIPKPTPQIIQDTKQQYTWYVGESKTPVLSRAGFKVNVIRVLYKDGKEVSRKLLYVDTYEPIVGKTYVGTIPKGGRTPPPKATATPKPSTY